MKSKLKISVKKIIADIRSGKKDHQLMEIYGLSAKGLQSLFRKLIDGRFITEEDLQNRDPSYEDTAELSHSRSSMRGYPVVRLPVYDLDDISRKPYYIKDVSENGIQVAGIDAKVGENKKFLIQSVDFADFSDVRFVAQCRWVKPKTERGPGFAGFQIVEISEDGRRELLKIIDSVTFCFD